MKFSRLSLAAVIAFVFAAGTLLADDSFEYKGYMRVGTQWTSKFTAPTLFGQGGAQKWAGRLGNEDQSRPNEDPFFLEQTFIKNWKNDANNWAKCVVLMNYHGKVNGDNSDYLTDDTTGTNGNTKLRIRQAYIEMGGLGFAPDMSFWIGKKFLNRDDVFAIDWYFLDFSGNGMGVTNIAGIGLDVAYIQKLSGNNVGGDAADEEGRVASNNLVLKFENDMVRVDANIKYVAKNGSTVEENYTDYMGSVMYKPERFFFFLDGSSKIVAQAATGGQANAMWFGNRFTNNIEESWQYSADLKTFDAFAYDVFATGVATIDNLNVQPVIGYRHYSLDRSNTGGDSTTDWKCDHVFATARGTFNVTPNLGVALEAGYSMARQDNIVNSWGTAGPVVWAGFNPTKDNEWTKELKIAPAVILTMDSSYYTRPQLRLYAIWKTVGDGFKAAATAPYDNKSSALWYGAQAEAWW